MNPQSQSEPRAQQAQNICEHCGDPARLYVAHYTGPEGLAILRLHGLVWLCEAHVKRFSDMYRFEPANYMLVRRQGQPDAEVSYSLDKPYVIGKLDYRLYQWTPSVGEYVQIGGVQ